MLNKKDERIRRLIERGITDKTTLARKLGYAGASLVSGVEKVQEAVERIKANRIDKGRKQ